MLHTQMEMYEKSSIAALNQRLTFIVLFFIYYN